MFTRILANRTLHASQRRSQQTFGKHRPQGNTQRRFGPNGVVGALVFGFVGGVYFYTVSQLKKQGDELMEELDELEKELGVEGVAKVIKELGVESQ